MTVNSSTRPKCGRAACVKAGHPLLYINLSLSGKYGQTVEACHCGESTNATEARKAWLDRKKVLKKLRAEITANLKKKESDAAK